MRAPDTSLVVLLLALCQQTVAFHRTTCAATIERELLSGSLKHDDQIFFRNAGKIMSNISSIELTIAGCEAQCGSKFDWYEDVGPRLTTWLIPAVLLIGNLCLATLGKPNSIFTLLHLLGDPIDSFWSLLTKLEAWNRCWDLAEHLSSHGAVDKDHVRDRGTILAAILELEGPGSDPIVTYQRIINNSTLDRDDPVRPKLHHLCREIANEISDSSTNELPRTYLAILSYIFAILGAFVEAIGGKSSSQPGGRIGSAMFLSWLLPIILLSNSIGSFTSRRTLVRILERFAKATRPTVGANVMLSPESPIPQRGTRSPSSVKSPLKGFNSPDITYFAAPEALSPPLLGNYYQDQQRRSSEAFRKPSADHLDLQIFSQDRPSSLFGRKSPKMTSFDNAQPWFGGIYTYQSEKKLARVPSFQKRTHNPIFLLCLAIFPIVNASVTAFLIIWFTPTIGLTCRHVPLLAITGLWLLNTFVGSMAWRTVATGRYHWWITICKDTFIAVPSVLMIFLQSSGLFNSCYCWSSVWSRGANAFVQLDPDGDRKHNAETIYPVLVWACLGLQVFVFLLALRLSKRGRSMMRRDERTKMADFWEVHRGVNVASPQVIEQRKHSEWSPRMMRKPVGVEVEIFGVLPPPALEAVPLMHR